MSVYKNDNHIHFNESLNSIWSMQTLKPYEIVLIQDGDVSEEIKSVLNQWKKKLGKKLILIVNKVNLGLTKSLNLGIKKCSGDLIARMDADDISKKNRFELQVNFLKKNLDVDVLGGSMQEFDDFNSCLYIRKYPLNMQQILKTISKASPLCHPSVMFRKKVFDDGNFYDENYKTSQDIDFWFKLISKGYKIANIDNVIILFRKNKDFYKRRSLRKGITEFKIYLIGIFNLFGFSIKLLLPFSRLFFRFLPSRIVSLVYSSTLRQLFIGKNFKSNSTQKKN